MMGREEGNTFKLPGINCDAGFIIVGVVYIGVVLVFR